MYIIFLKCIIYAIYLTPLHYAASNGHDKVIEFLINHGASVDCTDYFGKTPLHMAAANGHVSSVSVLLDKGADIDSKDNVNYAFSGIILFY